MSGIAWFIKNIDSKGSENLIEAMLTKIIHRGPDGQWFWISNVFEQKFLSLGQVNLNKDEHQPLFYDKYAWAFSKKKNPKIFEEIAKKSVALVFDWNIYNFLEIRKELIDKWYNFGSESDEEVVLASYLEWWVDCVKKFNGEWAFALRDPNKKELFCSRDVLWVKPFYYYWDGESFVFASEIKAILEDESLDILRKSNIDSEALDFYFTMGYIPAPWTIYKSIKKLEARHSLIISFENWKLKSQKTCHYNLPKYRPIADKKTLIEEWKQLLIDSVERRSKWAKVGAFLSGWLDSSSVVAVMTQQKKSDLDTFAIWFEGKYDETYYVDVVRKQIRTNHHQDYFQKEDFEDMIDFVSYHYDEPFADYSNFPTTFVCQLASQSVNKSLGWDGGDEIFGGYMMHQVAAQMKIIYKIPRFLRKLWYLLIPRTSNNLSVFSKLKEAMRVSLLDRKDFYANIGWSSLYKPEIYKQRVSEKFGELLEINEGNFVQSAIDFDLFFNTMADNFLVKVDRASASQSLEVTSPFFDLDWIAWSRKVPVKWKVSWRKTKIIMSTQENHPSQEEILKRGKKGFEPPIKDWILQEKFLDEIEEWLEKFSQNGVLSPQWSDFYRESVLKSDNSAWNVAKVRLFLFIKWWEEWME